MKLNIYFFVLAFVLINVESKLFSIVEKPKLQQNGKLFITKFAGLGEQMPAYEIDFQGNTVGISMTDTCAVTDDETIIACLSDKSFTNLSKIIRPIEFSYNYFKGKPYYIGSRIITTENGEKKKVMYLDKNKIPEGEEIK